MTPFLIVFALVLLHGITAGSEIAVVAMRKTRLKQLVEEGSARARSVFALRNHPERFLATVQIGITVIGIMLAVVGEPAFENLMMEQLKKVPLLTDYVRH